MSKLDDVLTKESDERKAVLDTIAKGTAAKDELVRVEQHLTELAGAVALRLGTNKAAGDRLAATRAAALAFKGSPEYTKAVTAASTLPGGLTDASMKGVVDTALTTPPVPGRTKYSEYVDVFEAARKAAADGAAAAAKARLDVAKAKLDLDAKIGPVLEAATRVELWLADSRKGIAASAQDKASGDIAGAWWTSQRAQALLAKIADASTKQALDDAEKALSDASDAYATRIEALNTAEKALPGLATAQQKAADELAKAEALVLAALTAEVKSVL